MVSTEIHPASCLFALHPAHLHSHPSPSSESLFTAAASATANSDFFQLLPFELREKILIDAFGDRTVHIDFQYEYPLLPLEKRGRPRTPGSCLKQQFETVDILKPRKWQWRSSICHLNVLLGLFGRNTSPCDDLYYREQDICSYWGSQGPMEKCSVGALGWLLSCRPALVP